MYHEEMGEQRISKRYWGKLSSNRCEHSCPKSVRVRKYATAISTHSGREMFTCHPVAVPGSTWNPNVCARQICDAGMRTRQRKVRSVQGCGSMKGRAQTTTAPFANSTPPLPVSKYIIIILTRASAA